ncbi:FAD-dependent oxidoreductase [Fulvivirga maritima]|uniref:FAD-binding protein n=1 Tax=Fulvivirga maritima TaxID=2904247 RepID=UPI001F3EE645|nr:FAD-binding protein [Fulvivirga maritima]UII25988.1 FAD-dependent oxidoreductase [Fulvivirga maritima]
MSKKHLKNKRLFFGRPVWQNSTKTLKVEPLLFLEPKSLEELEDMVQKGITEDIPVRAVGAGHSFSTAPESQGILVSTDHLNKVETYPYAGNPNYIEVQGGITSYMI